MDTKKRSAAFPAEVCERAVYVVREHRDEDASEWATVRSIVEKMGYNAEMLRTWVRQAQRDQGEGDGITSEVRDRLRGLERKKWGLECKKRGQRQVT